MSSPSILSFNEKSGVLPLDVENLRISPSHERPLEQPARPRCADASPLGLLAFATGVFLISCYGVHARGVVAPNMLLGVLIFFSGICQFISGIASLVTGDTFSATVFPSYAAFNFAYALIYLPGSGILAAYTDSSAPISTSASASGAPTTPALTPEFTQALAIWIWAWFILTCIFLVGALRINWVLISTLGVLAVDLACQACGLMFGVERLVLAGNGLGFAVCFLAYYAGAAGLWGNGATPIRLPMFPVKRDKVS